LDKKQFEANLTRGIAYRHGLEWHDDNVRNMRILLKDFKVKFCFIKFKKRIFFCFSKTRDVRIIIANFNQTVAAHMFCHVCFIKFQGKFFIDLEISGSS
jgi:hypothetical protein